MIKALKKNQIIIFAIALMLVTAGYLNYSMQTEKTAEVWSNDVEEREMAGIGDAKLVSNNNLVEDSNTLNSVSSNKAAENNLGNSIDSDNDCTNQISETSAKIENEKDDYFSESKLEREKMYSEKLETYQTMIASTNISSEQRYNAQVEISNINSEKNAIMIAENLIKNKGFKDLIIFVNDESVSVVVRSDELKESDIAQIQNIVERELKVEVKNIHISNK